MTRLFEQPATKPPTEANDDLAARLAADPLAPRPPVYQPGVIDDGAYWRWMDDLMQYYAQKRERGEL